MSVCSAWASPRRPSAITCTRGVRSRLVRPPLHSLSVGCPRRWSKALGGHASPSEARAQQDGGRVSVEQRKVSTSAAVEEREQERELLALEELQQKEAQFGWLFFWVASAVAFGLGVWATEGPDKAQEFFAGYILEQSLSIDNLFVFVLVFNYFKTPPAAQARVLSYGIATAAILRAVLIVVGVELVKQFEPVLILFAGILLVSSYKLLVNSASDDDEGDLTNNEVVQFCRKFITTTDTYDGNKFFTVLADGTKAATPLLLALAVVELSDVLFAVDSIPAVFGVTLDPFIVYSSNIFAILSLRSVYFFMASVMTQLRYLDKAVAVVLGFIGAKMLLEVGGIEVGTDVSLLIVAAVLGTGVGASILNPIQEHESKGSD